MSYSVDPHLAAKPSYIGVDASSFMPFLSMLSGGMGGSAMGLGASKPTDAKSDDTVKAIVLKQQADLERAQRTTRYVVYGAVGLGLVGLVYLLAKK